MLVRLVHLHFRADAVAQFERLFAGVAPRIRAFDGCHHLELWRDLDDPTRFSTYSLWQDTDALDAYRHSDLFVTTWAETRRLFASRAQACSCSRVTSI